jgi:ribosomal protein S18 acetylase RimI-like enzyme
MHSMIEDVAVAVLDHRRSDVAVQIAELQRAAYAVEARLIGFDGIPPLHETVADVIALDLTMLALIDHGQPLAILGYRRTGPNVEIDRLAVHQDHFRRGLARRLIGALHTREANASRFAVSTGRDNLPAVRLYEAMGYQSVDEVELPEGVAIVRLVRES